MRRWSFNFCGIKCRAMDKVVAVVLAGVVMAGCEKPILPEGDTVDTGAVVLEFTTVGSDYTTRAVSGIAAYASKLNVQLFDEDGQKVFSSVKTQTKDDDGFGTMAVELADGVYTVVAVAHSSARSATIKSPSVVQFTAQDGEKLTDTFCHVSTVEVSGESHSFTLPMHRAVAMVQLHLTDDVLPEDVWYIKADYSGGSANVNPTTLEGITKSKQSERRIKNDLRLHQFFTFPYMSETGTLKMTISATTSDGTVLRQRTFDEVSVTRNRITTYEGKLFGDGEWTATMTDFSFVVNADWDGEVVVGF
jgi:hypothetical protein